MCDEGHNVKDWLYTFAVTQCKKEHGCATRSVGAQLSSEFRSCSLKDSAKVGGGGGVGEPLSDVRLPREHWDINDHAF